MAPPPKPKRLPPPTNRPDTAITPPRPGGSSILPTQIGGTWPQQSLQNMPVRFTGVEPMPLPPELLAALQAMQSGQEPPAMSHADLGRSLFGAGRPAPDLFARPRMAPPRGPPPVFGPRDPAVSSIPGAGIGPNDTPPPAAPPGAVPFHNPGDVFPLARKLNTPRPPVNDLGMGGGRAGSAPGAPSLASGGPAALLGDGAVPLPPRTPPSTPSAMTSPDSVPAFPGGGANPFRDRLGFMAGEEIPPPPRSFGRGLASGAGAALAGGALGLGAGYLAGRLFPKQSEATARAIDSSAQQSVDSLGPILGPMSMMPMHPSLGMDPGSQAAFRAARDDSPEARGANMLDPVATARAIGARVPRGPSPMSMAPTAEAPMPGLSPEVAQMIARYRADGTLPAPSGPVAQRPAPRALPGPGDVGFRYPVTLGLEQQHGGAEFGNIIGTLDPQTVAYLAQLRAKRAAGMFGDDPGSAAGPGRMGAMSFGP